MTMTDLPSIPDLQAFLAAARTLHFTKAAASLHIAQPTLSLAIRRLEKSLGIPLFDRLGRSVRLTTAGETFRTHAAAALATLTRARLAVSDLASLHAGTLRVGVTHILAASLLPQTLAAFHKKYPRVALHAELLTSANVQRRLLDDSPDHPPLDLGITFSPPTAPELLAHQLFTETVILALPRRHPLAQKKSLPFRHLANVPLALTTHDFATRRLLESTAAAQKIPLHIAMEFNDIPLLLATAPRANLPIVIARRAITAHPPHGAPLTLLPITHPTLTHTAHLLWHRDRHRTTAARTFTNMLQESLAHR